MVATSTFAHVVGSSDPGTRLDAAGYDWQAVGENIATGFGTPRDVIHAWMASTPHCQNVLDPNIVDVGVGMNPNPVEGYASGPQPSTWTEDLALPVYVDPPSDNYEPADGCPYETLSSP
jgi:uncharacterized protein YkwD